MSSLIDPTKPTYKEALTSDVRANFSHAKTEIVTLQSNFASLQDKIDALQIEIDNLKNTAADGFLYIPICNGSPTGVPILYNGRAPIVFDHQTNKIWLYNSGWKSATIS